MARIRQITSREGLSPEQAAVYDNIASGARGAVYGPHTLLLHKPRIADPVDRLGVYVRYDCSVPERLRELAILTVATHWQTDYEWFVHAPLARAQGLSPAVLEAVAARATPPFETEDDAIVHRFTRQVLEDGRPDEATYGAATALLGEMGVLDLTTLIGYYTLIALPMNVFRLEPGPGEPIPWRQA